MEEPTTRERLTQLVYTMPGIHLRMAQRALEKSIGTVVHHVEVLVDDGIIRREREGRYVRLYPNARPRGSVTHALAKRFWRLSSAAGRVFHVLSRGPMRLVEVARRAGVSKQLAYYHLRRLLSQGLVRLITEGGRKLYSRPSSYETF